MIDLLFQLIEALHHIHIFIIIIIYHYLSVKTD